VSGNISGQAGSVANALTAGTFLTSGGTFDGSAARTFAVDATDANTASKVVARDASGNFSAGTITATLSGSATSATTATNLAGGAANRIAYQTSAGISAFITAPTASNQVLNWNGSAFTWSAGTISGVALGSNLNALTAGTYLTSAGTYDGSTARTFAVDATTTNTASKVVARDASGNFSAGTITAALNGNASTVTNGIYTTNYGNYSTFNQVVVASQAGFQSATFSAGRNRIWSFANSDGYGISYFQGGTDTIGFHFGTASLAGSQFQFAQNGNLTATGTVSAARGTFTPNTSGVSTGVTVVNGDLTAYRSGGTTGVVYLSNAGSHYLYWDGTNYNLNAGNLVCTGNVTAYSDERLKKDWAELPENFLSQLARIKHGTYTRIDSGDRQAGVSAQQVQAFLPEVVQTDEKGNLTLAYGNAALVAAVKLAERVVALEARIAALEAKG
jgi:hypothetical protein